ncbi:hypothetical protein EZV62_015683 [Acer yangbiense]|uniref:Reverse transcriptase Ty1/copia-type domain-containing protein n=1 Tax=Acer yangbiense TaxID=1000413 RepID=A0A5C7HLT2_9ROSI|nr:hypothetical protein EZV62_015683 [Acer yangbiense]
MRQDDGSKKTDASLYISLVGSLLYLTATIPDIMFDASLLPRYMQRPTRNHMGAAKRVLRHMFLEFKEAEDCYIIFSKSRICGCNKSNFTIQAIWLRRILEDIGEKQEDPTVLYCDNKSAITMGKNPISHDRTKHIAIKFHFIRKAIEQGEIQLM